MDLLRRLMERGEGVVHVNTTEDLERLVTRATQERQALQALVTSAHNHAARFPQVNASCEETEQRAAGLAQQLDALAARVDDFKKIVHQVQTLENRIIALDRSVQKAEERVEGALSRESHIQEHRDAVEKLVSLGQGTLAQIDGLKQESAALARLETQIPVLRAEFEPLFDQSAALRTDLDLLRGGIATLAQDAESGREASLKARAHATKATEIVSDLQRKLEPISHLHALSQDTDAQLRSLNALAEHVAAKIKALENQQSVVDHALVESRRVHEMVWDMDVQIGKLNEESKRATRVEETLASSNASTRKRRRSSRRPRAPARRSFAT